MGENFSPRYLALPGNAMPEALPLVTPRLARGQVAEPQIIHITAEP